MLSELIIATNIGIWINFFRDTVFYSIRLKYALRNNPDKLKFYILNDFSFVWADNEIEPSRKNVIVCRFWFTDKRFLEWKMTETGEMMEKSLTGKLDKKGNLKSRRESILLFHERTKKENSTFMKYKVISVFSYFGPLAWTIKRYTAEPFVIAKMAGFEEYNINEMLS